MEAYPSVRNSRRFDIPINIQMFLHFRNFYTSTAVQQHRTPIIIVVVRKTGKVVGWISYLRMGVFYTNFSTRFPNFLISCKSEPLILLIMLVFLFITYHSVPKYNDSCFQHWCTNALLIFREIVVGVLYYIILYTWYYLWWTERESVLTCSRAWSIQKTGVPVVPEARGHDLSVCKRRKQEKSEGMMFPGTR